MEKGCRLRRSEVLRSLRHSADIRTRTSHHRSPGGEKERCRERLASRKIQSVEELETLYLRAQNRGHYTIDRLEKVREAWGKACISEGLKC